MKKLILKIAAFVVALALIVGVGLFANALIGNPISKLIARTTAEKYLSETYPDMTLELSDAEYSFKETCYHVHVTQPDQLDGEFTLAFDMLGRLLYDDYEDRVPGGWNTAYRIEADYRKAVETVLNSSTFPSDYSIGYGEMEFVSRRYKDEGLVPSYALVTEDLTLGGAYNLGKLGAQAGKVTVYLYDDTVTAERLAELLLLIRESFDNAGVTFYVMDCVLESPDEALVGDRVEVMDFLYSDIHEENLTERVEAADRAAKAYYAAQDEEKLQEAE